MKIPRSLLTVLVALFEVIDSPVFVFVKEVAFDSAEFSVPPAVLMAVVLLPAELLRLSVSDLVDTLFFFVVVETFFVVVEAIFDLVVV